MHFPSISRNGQVTTEGCNGQTFFQCEWFLPTRATFRVGLASESHWLQPMLVLIVHLLAHTSKYGVGY